MPDQAGATPAASAVPQGYEKLGYDCVQTDWTRNIAGFGCSPLSCNGLACKVAVNAHCLIDDATKAIETARKFAHEQPEPGVYCVVEVWRKPRGASGS